MLKKIISFVLFNLLICASEDNSIHPLDIVTTCKPLQNIIAGYVGSGWDQLHNSEINSYHLQWMAYSPDNKYLICDFGSKNAKIYDAVSNDLLISFPFSTQECFAISPCKRYEVSVIANKIITLVDKQDSKILARISFDKPASHAVRIAYFPDGKQIAISFTINRGSSDYTREICIYDNLLNLEQKITEPDHDGSSHTRKSTSEYYSKASSPDGKLSARENWDQTIILENTQTKQPINTLSIHAYKHDSRRMKISFSPDSTYLASAGTDRTVKITDVNTLAIQTLGTLSSVPDALTISPNGKYIAIAFNGFSQEINVTFYIYYNQAGDLDIKKPITLTKTDLIKNK